MKSSSVSERRHDSKTRGGIVNDIRCSICDVTMGYSSEYVSDICCPACEEVYKEKKLDEHKSRLASSLDKMSEILEES